MFFSEPFFKRITRARLRVEGELIICGRNFIHIPGITRVWVGWITRPVNWEALFLLALAFLTIFALKFTGLRSINPISHVSTLIGAGQAMGLLFLIVAAGGAYIYYILRMTGQGLHVELASGHTYVFFTRNRDFLQKAYRLLGELIKTGPQREGLIDFNDLTAKNTTRAPGKPAARPSSVPAGPENGIPALNGPDSWQGRMIMEMGRLLRAVKERHPQSAAAIKQLELSLGRLKAGDKRGFQQAVSGLPPYLGQLAGQLGLPMAGRLLTRSVRKGS